MRMGRISTSTHPVAHVRRITGLSQKDFAEALGISRDHLARIEAGSAPLSDGVAGQISEEFGARLPSNSQSTPATDSSPRAEDPHKGRPWKDLPPYSKEHYEQWKRRTQVRVSYSGPQAGKAFLRSMADVLYAIGEAFSGGGVDRLRIEVEGLAPSGEVSADILKRLLVAIARTASLKIEKPMGENRWLMPDLAVAAKGGSGGQIKIFVRGRGGVTKPAWPATTGRLTFDELFDETSGSASQQHKGQEQVKAK